MKYDSVIFDLDGTLLDTLGDLTAGVNHALSLHGMPERTEEEIRTFVGNGVRMLIARSVPDGTPDDVIDQVLLENKQYYAEHCMVKTKPYDGVIALLKKLGDDGVPTAIVSNKNDRAVGILSKHFFDGLCKIAVGEREGIRRKPAPDAVLEAMKILDSKCPVYVGDSEVDVMTAKNAGIDGIFVTWGFRTADDLNGAGGTVTVDTVDELYEEIMK